MTQTSTNGVSGGGRHQQQVVLGWVRHDEALTKTAAACWAGDRFTDVTIFCEDRILHAHRLVLASMSPLLANLLAEAESNETALMLPEVKAEDMRLLLQFIYQGEVVLPPRRTAALLDLAAQLCVAGVRGGGGSGGVAAPGTTTPPSPPRSDSPAEELEDSSDRNNDESEDHVSSEDDEHVPSEDQTTLHSNDTIMTEPVTDKEACQTEETCAEKQQFCPAPDSDKADGDSNDDSNDAPMNLASRPEVKVNGTVNCPRPKPCNSSPPDLNVFPSSISRSNSHNNSNSVYTSSRTPALSYYQHPALRGCHPFSLTELAINQSQRGHHQRTDSHRSPKRQLLNNNNNRNGSRMTADSPDVDVTMDMTGGDSSTDREIDLSLRAKSGFHRSSSSDEKMTPSPDQDSSIGSNESVEQLKGGRGLYGIHPNGSGSSSLSLADKMFLMPSGGVTGGAGGGGLASADPRRTYLETVLQESLVQQSYTIVLPSHLSGAPLPLNADHLSPSPLHGQALDSAKAWNLAGKNSAAAAVAELQCLQGLFASSRESGYARAALQCASGGDSGGRGSGDGAGDDEDDDEDDEESDLPTNLSTAKNGNCGSSSSSSLSSKRNGKEGYSCQVCRKMFTSSSNLAVHSMIHSGTKPFKCDLCSWSFRQKAHLQKHMRHIHKIIVAK